jgi:hypothetical protein
MPPKKTTGLGAALQPLDVNQETLREGRSQKRKATSPTPQEEELDQEIRDLEAIHQQVQKKMEKMLRLVDLQKKIDEAAKKCVISPRRTKTEGPIIGSFVNRIHTRWPTHLHAGPTCGPFESRLEGGWIGKSKIYKL